MKKNHSWFPALARGASTAAGTPGMFAFALLVVIVWALTGPLFHYSDTPHGSSSSIPAPPLSRS